MLSSSRWWRNSRRAHQRSRGQTIRQKRARACTCRRKVRPLSPTTIIFKKKVHSRGSRSSRWHQANPSCWDNRCNQTLAWSPSQWAVLDMCKFTRVKMFPLMVKQLNWMHNMKILMSILEFDQQLREEVEPTSSNTIQGSHHLQSNIKAQSISENRRLWGNSKYTSDNASNICTETSSMVLAELKGSIQEEWLSRICWLMEEKRLCLAPSHRSHN